MSKKNFSSGLDSILGNGHPIIPKKKETIAEEEKRAPLTADKKLWEKLKSIAYWDRILIKDIVDSALSEAISKYEKKNGEIKPMPKK